MAFFNSINKDKIGKDSQHYTNTTITCESLLRKLVRSSQHYTNTTITCESLLRKLVRSSQHFNNNNNKYIYSPDDIYNIYKSCENIRQDPDNTCGFDGPVRITNT